jgi:hypothetical protein
MKLMAGHVPGSSLCLHHLSTQDGEDKIPLNLGLGWLEVSCSASENIADLLSHALQVLGTFVPQRCLGPLPGTRRAFRLQLRHMQVTASLRLGAATNTYLLAPLRVRVAS